MEFRTPVPIPESSVKLEVEDLVFSIGSCFSSEISSLLDKGQIQTCHNPFGTLFNPYSIAKAVRAAHDSKVYTEEDLIQYQDKVISLDHHSKYNSGFAHKTLEKINADIEVSNRFLQSANWIVVTFGSAYVHEFLPRPQIVANCHKLPGTYFKKRLLSAEEIKSSMQQMVEDLMDICPSGVNILFTLSPVRHTKEGIVENQRSKALLLSTMHEIVEQYEEVTYLPVYELMLDELRDYRFYKEDMLHPNAQAVNYIFEKFGNAYFSEATMEFIEENFKIMRSLQHRSSQEQDPKYLEFREALKRKIQKQREKVNHPIFLDDL